MPDNKTIQLRSLATQNRETSVYLDLAADLQENGYQTDQERIDNEIQKANERVNVLENLLKENNIEIPNT